MKKCVVITGARGSGKREALKALKKKFTQVNLPLLFYPFDGKMKVRDQIKKEANASVVMSAEVSIAFIKEALKKADLTFSQVILLDCNDEVRKKRGGDRQAMIFSTCLREEAKQEIACIIDTSFLSSEDTADAIMRNSGLGKLFEKRQSQTVQIVPYDTAWPQIFEKEAKVLKKAMENACLAVYHIGSTSVPGLCAKPKIDLLVVVNRFQEIEITKLEHLGYITRGEVIPTGRFFKKENPSIHLHIFEEGNPNIEKNILFRNWLCSHPEDRAAYGQLKKKLALQFDEHNAMAYCRAKAEFIEQIIDKARRSLDNKFS